MATASTSSMSGSTPPSAHDSARHAFNIKVLRRHDASISSILYSASFVVLYQYSTSSSSWTKTGIEGPMFLFKRSESPFYGAFVLNRNGVENWASSIRGEDDLEVSEDFVIFRSTSGEKGDHDDEEDDEEDGDGDRVVGIWVFEKEQRVAMGDEMIRLQTLAEQEDGQEPAGITSTTSAPLQQQQHHQQQPPSQSISLDALFASASSSSSSSSAPSQPPAAAAFAPTPPASSQAQPSQLPGSGASLLDAIFQSQSQSQSQSQPQTKQQEEKSAQPAAAPAAPSAPPAVVEEKTASPRDEAKNKKNDSAAAGLMAMLGLGGGAGAGKKEEEEEKKSKEQQVTQSSAPPAPAPAAASKTEPKTKSKSHTSTNGTATASFPQTASSVLLDAHEAHRSQASQETAPGSESTTPAMMMMSKGDFVREILQLIHTDKDFVAALYDGYVERVKGR